MNGDCANMVMIATGQWKRRAWSVEEAWWWRPYFHRRTTPQAEPILKIVLDILIGVSKDKDCSGLWCRVGRIRFFGVWLAVMLEGSRPSDVWVRRPTPAMLYASGSKGIWWYRVEGTLPENACRH